MRFAALLVLAACGRIGFDPGGASADGGGDDAAPPAEFLAGYQYRKRIAIAALTSEPQDNFVVRIGIVTDPELSPALVDGDDFVVTAGDGQTVLPFEKVSFDGQNLELWAQVPTLPITPIALYLYYGGPASTPSSPWNSNVFAGVWHMQLKASTFGDSTGGGNDGSATGTEVPQPAAGIAGDATSYDGNDDSANAGDPGTGSLDFGTGSFSYSVWVNVTNPGGEFDVALFKGGCDPPTAGYDLELGDNEWDARISDGTNDDGRSFGNVTEFLGRWVHLVAVIDRAAGELRVYADGVLKGTQDITTLGSVSSNETFQFGRNVDHFRGLLDEVRVYRVALSDKWIVAEHANLAIPQLVAIGLREDR